MCPSRDQRARALVATVEPPAMPRNEHDIRGMRLLAHDPLGGHGCLGEGVRVQLARDGRRILWLAHERAPVGVAALDVGDPRAPEVIRPNLCGSPKHTVEVPVQRVMHRPLDLRHAAGHKVPRAAGVLQALHHF